MPILVLGRPGWAARLAFLRQLLAWLSPSSTEQHYWAGFAFGWELPKGLEEQISSRCPSSFSPFLHLIHPLFWEGVFYFSGKVWYHTMSLFGLIQHFLGFSFIVKFRRRRHLRDHHWRFMGSPHTLMGHFVGGHNSHIASNYSLR